MPKQDPLTLMVRTDRRRVSGGGRAAVDLVVEVAAAASAEGAGPSPLTVAFALDLSSSMTGAPLEHLIVSMEQLIDLLRPGDRAGIVGFRDAAEICAPITQISEGARTSLRRAVRGLRAGGWTHVEAALVLASEMIDRDEGARSSRRAILLLSDGAPTRGLTDPVALGELARSLRRRAAISALGYGAAHDEQVLGAMAEGGGGHYQYIPDPRVSSFALGKALGTEISAVAEDARLEIIPARGVKLRRVLPRPGERALSLGDLSAGGRQILVAELELERGLDLGERPLCEVRLEYRLPATDERRTARVASTIEVASEDGPPDLEAVARAFLARADRARAEAQDLGARGDARAAAQLLRDLVGAIEQAPGYSATPGSLLFEAREQLVDDAAFFEDRPSPARLAEFRRGQRGDLARGGVHAGAAAPGSAAAARIREAIAGGAARSFFVLSSGERVPVPVDGVIGRSTSADVVIPSDRISRKHAHVFALDGDFYLADLGSTGGSVVNGARINVHRLADGDRIELGGVALRFQTARE